MDELAIKISQWISDRVEQWESLIGDDNEAIPDEDALIYEAIDDLTEWIAQRMANHPAIEQAFEQARIEVRESAAEAAAYTRAMNGGIGSQLRWHGMNVKDFI